MIRIAMVAEDIGFVDLLRPAIHALARDAGAECKISTPEVLHGCVPAKLAELLRNGIDEDILVIASDSMGGGHSGRATFRQKGRAIEGLVAGRHPLLSLAVAEPCAEAWLLADLRALAAGLGDALQMPCSTPATLTAPRGEREAKTLLGRTVLEIAGSRLARSGFEFASHVIARCDLRSSPSPSLQSWANDFASKLQRLSAQ